MEKDLLKIIEHFDINNQQRKLQEEVFELQEAITKHENKNPIITTIDTLNKVANNISGKEYKMLSIENIKEEIADCMVILEQFKLHYGISNEEITKIFWEKVNRTLERIESGDYEK